MVNRLRLLLGFASMEYHLVAPKRVTKSCAARGSENGSNGTCCSSGSGVTILVGGVDSVLSAVLG